MQKILGNISQGLFFVVSAPAGTGKNTLLNKLKKEFSCIKESISFTTRQARGEEKEGEDYFFIKEEEFQRKIAEKEFLEYAQVFEHLYGTDKKKIEDLQNKGIHVVLVIDTQGAMQIKEKIPSIFIFIKPPSLEELEKRLKKRGTESSESIRTRLKWAAKEMDMSSYYDYVVVNDDEEIAYDIFRSIFIAEEHRLNNF